MFKACSKCGKIHDASSICPYVKREYTGGAERKLRSKYSWTQKSKQIREQSNHLCEVCKDKGVYTYQNIEVHHIVKVRDDETLLLDNYNLICLCQECHEKADKGLIDKEYLKRLARQREESG